MSEFMIRVFSIGPKRMRVLYPLAFAAAVIGGVGVGLRLTGLLGL